MQQPTCTNLHIRTVADANRVLHAVKRGIRPMVTRRLDDDERLALRSGCVYVWEERSNNPLEVTGQEIQRFTEGRSWGPSRAREDFLLYFEKDGGNRSIVQRYGGLGSQQLIKQTYSVYVDYPKNTRKWHLNAYYTQETVDRLQTVDDIPDLRSLVVPEGAYICARAGGQRRNARMQRRTLDESTESQLQPLHPYHFDPYEPSSPSPPPLSPSPQQWSPLANAQTVLHPNGRVASPRVCRDSVDPQRQLAPLEYLQNITPSGRNPADDEMLKSFRRRL
ncbi:hypothetical protein BXZ70DRAFT_912542 [Cristinia sonorae]|uniref:cAMP-independent regulatory protein pac2 n=1 Tax=Cristinia sonorae TaxID=1940300 RepID=A0A8K0V1C0_9AGAR|nr:hypothetical protein BXZ70DRAFT_912542 [Cristinia sonorae]